VIVPDSTKETPKVDVLKTVLDKATLPLALVVLAIALALIFHRKLSELIERTTSIEIDPMKRRWRVDFGQRVQQEQQKAAVIQRAITARSPVPVAPPPGSPMTGADQTGRDIVLEAWVPSSRSCTTDAWRMGSP
jgi:hypothetical protein